MNNADLRLSLEVLLEKTSFIDCDPGGFYSFQDLFDYDGEDIYADQHAARLLLARARMNALYAENALRRDDVEDAEQACHAAYQYLADGLLRITRPNELRKLGVPPDPPGATPGGGSPDRLLYEIASDIYENGDWGRKRPTWVLALHRAVMKDPDLLMHYQNRSAKALVSAMKRGRDNGDDRKSD